MSIFVITFQRLNVAWQFEFSIVVCLHRSCSWQFVKI